MLRSSRFIWRTCEKAAQRYENLPLILNCSHRRFAVAAAVEHIQANIQPISSFSNESSKIAPQLQESGIDLELILRNIKLEKTGKSHVETENDALRQSLLAHRVYHTYFVPGSKTVALSSLEAQRVIDQIRNAENVTDSKELIALLKKSSQLAFTARRILVENPVFTVFADLLKERLKSCDTLVFSDLLDLTQAFRQFRFEQLHHSFPAANLLRSIIDAKSIESYPKLSRKEGFILSDIWYLSSCARLAEFPQYFISRQRSVISSYSPQELVRMLLAVSVQRSADPGFMLQIERLILPHIAGFSGVELAVITAGFFKTQVSPGIELVDKIVSRLQALDAHDMVDDVIVPSCSKFFAKYAQPALHDSLKNFMLKIKPNISKLKMSSLAHVTGILEVTLYMDEDFLDQVSLKLLNQLPGSRLKDISKICRTNSVLNYRPIVHGKDFFDQVLEFIDSGLSLQQCLKYPSKCIELLASLARMGLFSARVMAMVSSPIFLKEYQDQPDSLLVDLDFLQLHYAVEIECPQRQCPLLDASTLKRMTSTLQTREGPMNTALGSLVKGLQTLLNLDDSVAKNLIASCMPLPYAERMLIIRLKNLEPVPLPQAVLSQENSYVVKVPPKDGSCFVICYHPWWSFTTPLHRFTGFHEMKLRHLRALGYNVIAVDQNDTQNLTFVQKMKYLRDRLFFERFDAVSSITVPVNSNSNSGVPA